MSLSRTNRKSLNRRIDKYVKVSLTNAQILALNATPIAVLPAPVSTGYVHLIDSVYATKAAGTAYTIGSNAGIDFKYTNGSGAFAINVATTGFLDQTTAALSFSDAGTGVLPVAGAQIVAQAKTASPTGTGAPGISMRIYFKTVPTLV